MSRRLAVLVALLVVAPSAGASPVRFFAVGHEQRLTDVVSYQTFHDKMAALMDAAFPGRAMLVQTGVDDVASHVPPADPGAPAQALVVFPEDVGLLAALIGTRGAAARAQATSVSAIVQLLLAYGTQTSYYAAKYPGLPGIRVLDLATTDTLYRSFYETFRELAMTHRVYLAATANIAPARRVDEVTEPALVATLRDPDEPGRTYAYEAVSPLPRNTTFVFAPDGAILVPDGNGGTLRSPDETGGILRGTTDKAYLTPIEQPPPGSDAGLALAFGPVRDQDVIDTPVGRLAIVISKDAWMVDVNDRFAAKGANVVLQPEAFSEWAYATTPWQPDVFKEGGFANLQKIPQLLVNVDASMTGNFFDVTFDGQSAVIGRRRKGGAGPVTAHDAWVGQNADTGFLAVAPWIMPDPVLADATLGLTARRAQLAQEGAKLLPGSGVACVGPLAVGGCENGYREAVVWADVDLPAGGMTAPIDPARAHPAAFGTAVRVSGAETAPVAQHAPRVAAAGRRVFVVWHEERNGLPNVYLAMSRNGGRTFAVPSHVTDHAAGAVAELNPAIAVRGSDVWIAWQEFAAGRNDDRGRIEVARFTATGRKRGRDVRVDTVDDAGKWMPAIALAGTRPVVAWIDERDAGPAGEPLEHVYAARKSARGRGFDPPVRVDAGTPVALALHVDNKWSPALATAGGTVYCAWADFRNYNWDIFLARSDDGGASWGANVQVDDYPDVERIDERPTVAADRRGTVHVAWTDVRARAADPNVFYARSTSSGGAFAPNHQLDDSRVGFDPDHDTPTNQWHPSLALDHQRLFVAWQDDREGNPDIYFTTSEDGGTTFAPAERVDDTGTGGSAQSNPTLTIAGRGRSLTCYVAWEDDRNGNPDIYLARRKCSRARAGR